MCSLDSAIMEEYTKLEIPANQIVSDQSLASDFCNAVNRHLPEGFEVDQKTVNQRLLNLRRRGEANGGLPRLQRSYSGRGPRQVR